MVQNRKSFCILYQSDIKNPVQKRKNFPFRHTFLRPIITIRVVQNRKSFCISAIISDQKNYHYLSYWTGTKEKTIFHFRHRFCTTSGIRKESICPAFAVVSAWYKKEKLFAFYTTHALPNPHAESLLIPLLLRFCTGKRNGTKEKTIFHFRHHFRPAFSKS